MSDSLFTVRHLDGVARTYNGRGRRVFTQTPPPVEITITPAPPLAEHCYLANEKWKLTQGKKS